MGAPHDILLTRLAGGPQLRAEELAAITPEDWGALDALAGEHRLRPLLHLRWQHHQAIPPAIKAGWAAARRETAMTALIQRRVLIGVIRRLAGAGLNAIALKGAWLAWQTYPEPAVRPLRDLDLLLSPSDAVAARQLLLDEGWREATPSALAPEDWLARFKHLPELVSPEGVWLDLHARLWDEDGRAPPLPQGLWDRTIADPDVPELRFLGPIDQLMHLAIHATQHRFDGGPLMLSDFDRLIAREPFDWDAVEARACAEGWMRPLSLALAATRAWGCQGLWRGPDLAVPDQILADIPHLVAKPLAARDADIGAMKRGRRDIGWREKARRIWVRRERYHSTRAWAGWIGREIALSLRARGDAAMAERNLRVQRLDSWLREA